jgi:RimJ/RimL family protein N-acetyltransferase
VSLWLNSNILEDHLSLNPLQNSLELRDVQPEDLEIFFQHSLDPEALYMAAFTWKDPSDRAAFNARWEKILANKTGLVKTILCDGQVAGSVLSYRMEDEPEVSYWLGREFWGRGIATWALGEFLEFDRSRPMYARVAKDNLASLRVLQKCGFVIHGEDKGFANARAQEVEEFILILNAEA